MCWSEASVRTSILTTDQYKVLGGSRRVEDAQVITVEISKCYNSPIAVVEAQRPCANKGVTRKSFWRKGPECSCWCGKEGSAKDEEEKGKTSWGAESPEYSHRSTGRCERMYLRQRALSRVGACYGSHNVTRFCHESHVTVTLTPGLKLQHGHRGCLMRQ